MSDVKHTLKENCIGLVVIKILSFRQKALTTLFNRIIVELVINGYKDKLKETSTTESESAALNTTTLVGKIPQGSDDNLDNQGIMFSHLN